MKPNGLVWLVAALLVAGTAVTQAGYTARTNYILHCQGCHGADGVGGIPDEVPPLGNSVGYFLQVPGGRSYLIQVPGIAQAPVSDEELADVLNYILEHYSAAQLPASFRPYTSGEVAEVRRSGKDIVALRNALVAEIRERLGVRMWTLDEPIRVKPPEDSDGSGY